MNELEERKKGKQNLEDRCKFFKWCKDRDKVDCNKYESFKLCSYYRNYITKHCGYLK